MVATSPAASRRNQIVEATINVVAREGVAAASFERIRADADISSTRLISYHFDSKDELLRTVLSHIVERAAEFMSPRIAAAGTSRSKLDAYIRGNLDFLSERPSYAVAAVEVLGALPPVAASDADPLLVRLFVDGQKAGEFREFEPQLMAWVLRAAIDRIVLNFARLPATDLPAAAGQVAELFDRAVRPD